MPSYFNNNRKFYNSFLYSPYYSMWDKWDKSSQFSERSVWLWDIWDKLSQFSERSVWLWDKLKIRYFFYPRFLKIFIPNYN